MKTCKLAPEFLEGRQKIGTEPQNVRMRVDESGLVLYWDYSKSRQRKFVFVDAIVDLRIGRENPRELTLVCNKDYKTVSKWADGLFKWAYWHKKQYRSVLRDMTRLFAPLLLESSQKFRTENAYEGTELPVQSGHWKKSVETEDEILDAYIEKLERPEIRELFDELHRTEKRRSTPRSFGNFVNFTQRDSRLNDEIFPLKKTKAILTLIDQLEPGSQELSFRGFLRFLLGDMSTDIDSSQQRLKIADMMNPLPHYYIYSSS
ncbi:hypothetical protein M3Y99_00028900 [Aphelenchoides fujianensis]|nr:hypothetical protein M3Y99_00028900 [Aphelenchoides fujianensis]